MSSRLIRRLPFALLLVLCATASFADSALLRCGNLVDVERKRLVENQAILVTDGVIQDIGQEIDTPAGARVIDLTGQYCLPPDRRTYPPDDQRAKHELPGLIDAHTHLMTSGRSMNSSKTLTGLKNAQTMLRQGFTTLRVPGDGDIGFGAIVLRDAFAEGLFVGPRMQVAPHAICPLGGHCDSNSIAPDSGIPTAPHVIRAGEDSVREAVRRELKYGADWIKVYATGGIMSVGDDPRVQSFTDAELAAFADETHRHGKKITAHIHGAGAVKTAVRVGFDSVEHGTLMDDEAIKMMVESGTWLVPTVYVLDYILEQGETRRISAESMAKARGIVRVRDISFRKAYKAGVKMAVGSDQIFPHEHSAREFSALVRLGVSPMDAIVMGTINGARLMDLEDKIGSVEVGKEADIIAVPGNPLDNISILENVEFVMLGGRIIRND